MAKCGYVVLESGINYERERVVMSVNGRKMVKWNKRKNAWSGGELLHDYLNRAGQDGWRVVGTNGIGDSYTVMIILEKCMAD